MFKMSITGCLVEYYWVVLRTNINFVLNLRKKSTNVKVCYCCSSYNTTTCTYAVGAVGNAKPVADNVSNHPHHQGTYGGTQSILWYNGTAYHAYICDNSRRNLGYHPHLHWYICVGNQSDSYIDLMINNVLGRLQKLISKFFFKRWSDVV